MKTYKRHLRNIYNNKDNNQIKRIIIHINQNFQYNKITNKKNI